MVIPRQKTYSIYIKLKKKKSKHITIKKSSKHKDQSTGGRERDIGLQNTMQPLMKW